MIINKRATKNIIINKVQNLVLLFILIEVLLLKFQSFPQFPYSCNSPHNPIFKYIIFSKTNIQKKDPLKLLDNYTLIQQKNNRIEMEYNTQKIQDNPQFKVVNKDALVHILPTTIQNDDACLVQSFGCMQKGADVG